MKKSLSRILYLSGLVLSFIGGALLQASSTVAYALIGVAVVLILAAWIGSLITTAKLGRWGWFVCLIIFSSITMLVYIFWGPKTSAKQVA